MNYARQIELAMPERIREFHERFAFTSEVSDKWTPAEKLALVQSAATIYAGLVVANDLSPYESTLRVLKNLCTDFGLRPGDGDGDGGDGR